MLNKHIHLFGGVSALARERSVEGPGERGMHGFGVGVLAELDHKDGNVVYAGFRV